MKQNMGAADRVFRLIIAVLLIGLFLDKVIAGTFAVVLLIVSGVLLLTSLFGYCPLYALLKINSRTKATR